MPVTTGGVLGHTSERRQGVKFPYVGWDRSNLRNCDFQSDYRVCALRVLGDFTSETAAERPSSSR